MEANTSGVSGEAQLMDELKKLEQSARQYQQEVSICDPFAPFHCALPLPTPPQGGLDSVQNFEILSNSYLSAPCFVEQICGSDRNT